MLASVDPSRNAVRSIAASLDSRPMRLPRRLERFLLGSLMSLVALVAERRVVKALGKKR